MITSIEDVFLHSGDGRSSRGTRRCSWRGSPEGQSPCHRGRSGGRRGTGTPSTSSRGRGSRTRTCSPSTWSHPKRCRTQPHRCQPR